MLIAQEISKEMEVLGYSYLEIARGGTIRNGTTYGPPRPLERVIVVTPHGASTQDIFEDVDGQRIFWSGFFERWYLWD